MITVPQHTAMVTVINSTNIWTSTPSTPLTEGPAISWSVNKSAGQEPNTAEITISNLSQASVDAITGLVKTPIEFGPAQIAILQAAGASTLPSMVTATNLGIASVMLQVGYTGMPLWQWYVGQSTKIITARDTPETTLKLVCQDHGEGVGAGQIFPPKTYSAGSRVVDLIMDLINAMGLSADPLQVETAFVAAAATYGQVVSSVTNLLVPYTSAGSARKQLDQLFSALGLTWMVLDGVFYVLTGNAVLPGYGPLVFLPADGSLIGSPRRIEGGALEVDTVMRPGMIPWRAAVVVAQGVGDSAYRIRSIRSSGSTESGASATVTLEVLQTIPGLF